MKLLHFHLLIFVGNKLVKISITQHLDRVQDPLMITEQNLKYLELNKALGLNRF